MKLQNWLQQTRDICNAALSTTYNSTNLIEREDAIDIFQTHARTALPLALQVIEKLSEAHMRIALTYGFEMGNTSKAESEQALAEVEGLLAKNQGE